MTEKWWFRIQNS